MHNTVIVADGEDTILRNIFCVKKTKQKQIKKHTRSQIRSITSQSIFTTCSETSASYNTL